MKEKQVQTSICILRRKEVPSSQILNYSWIFHILDWEAKMGLHACHISYGQHMNSMHLAFSKFKLKNVIFFSDRIW